MSRVWHTSHGGKALKLRPKLGRERGWSVVEISAPRGRAQTSRSVNAAKQNRQAMTPFPSSTRAAPVRTTCRIRIFTRSFLAIFTTVVMVGLLGLSAYEWWRSHQLTDNLEYSANSIAGDDQLWWGGVEIVSSNGQVELQYAMRGKRGVTPEIVAGFRQTQENHRQVRWRSRPLGHRTLSDPRSTDQNISWLNRLGLRFDHLRRPGPPMDDLGFIWDAVFPYWLVVVLLCVQPSWVLMRYARRRHRIRSSLCAVCGYDLRATPIRCPECGTQASISVDKCLGSID